MEINNFISNFTSQLEIQPLEPITENTDFRSLEAWDSLTVLSIMAMVDEEYGVTLTGEEIRKSNTINDLFEIIKHKK